MPQICKICIHPDRQAIDDELSNDWERGLRAIGAQYGVSKDSLNRHAQNHLSDVAEDSPATAPARINSTEKRDCAEIAQKKDEEPEARQLAEVAEQKKSEMCDQKKEPDAEAWYRAFIGHWRNRMCVWQHEPAEWSFDNVEELIEAAISRGDLMVFGSIYVRTVQLWLRFRA
jgi:hypothetical protein